MPRKTGDKNKSVKKETVKNENKTIEEIVNPKIDTEGRFQCTCCGKYKPLNSNHFYMSKSILNKNTGRLFICKDCIFEIFEGYFKRFNSFKKAVYELCRLLDYPYIEKAYIGADQEANRRNKHIVATYITKINSLSEQNGYGSCFMDSDTFLEEKGSYQSININSNITDYDGEEMPNELVIKWGNSYKREELIILERFYEDMITTHFITTPQHKQILKFISKLNLKMDKCLESDDLSNFTKLSQQFDKLLQTSGLRPIDKTSSDVTIGIRNFSTIFEEVEKDGYIEPTPIKEKQDIIDRTITYIMNYTLKLLNMNQLISSPIDTPKMDEVN